MVKGISYFTVDFCTGMAQITEASPNITSTFMILLPTTLPMVISALPFKAAEILTAASGRDVPIATMVSPMTSWGIPNLSAMLDAPSTNQSAPFIKSTNPTTSNPNCKTICIPFPPVLAVSKALR